MKRARTYLRTSTRKSDAMCERPELTVREKETLRMSKPLDRALRCNALFVLLLVLVLSIAVLVLEAIQFSNPAHWSASSREPPRSTIGIAAVQTAIEYEYRFTEYRPPRRTEYRFAEYEYGASAKSLESSE